jgi:hypothetical protein
LRDENALFLEQNETEEPEDQDVGETGKNKRPTASNKYSIAQDMEGAAHITYEFDTIINHMPYAILIMGKKTQMKKSDLNKYN